MKKLNENGFTLIELLAVIVIMGILMLVAIPAVSRTIENSRKDTFVDVAKSYANAVRNMWAADELACKKSGDTDYTVASAVDVGDYYIKIDTTDNSAPTLLDQGGKSSWGNREMKGYVRVKVENTGTGTTSKRKTTYYVAVSDNTHGITDSTTSGIESSSLKRGNVTMTGVTWISIPSGTDVYTCIEN